MEFQLLKFVVYKILKFPEEIPGFSLESHFLPVPLLRQSIKTIKS